MVIVRDSFLEIVFEIYLCIGGPQFSTRAESNTFRAWGMSIIGMTTSPEAFLAREAEICYGVMAHVTDYDVWHETEDPVSVEAVIANLNANIEVAKKAIRNTVAKLADEPGMEAHHALAMSIISRRERAIVPAQTWEKLEPFIGKYYQQ